MLRSCQTPKCGRTFTRHARYCQQCTAALRKKKLCVWCAERPTIRRKWYCEPCRLGNAAVAVALEKIEGPREILPELSAAKYRGSDARERIQDTKSGG